MILGVLKEANDSEWGAPSFAQSKVKTDRVRFLSDFCNLNRKLKLKLYPMPKIREMLLKFDGFQYATALDLNMVYYCIRISEQASNLWKIILSWGKYQYKRLTMGVSHSPEIFQKKISEMFRGFEFIREYINDLLIITKGDWSDRLEKLELTLKKKKITDLSAM